MKALHGQDSAPQEKKQDDHLRDGEGRLGAVRREDVQGRDVKEGLHDEDEAIEVEGDDSETTKIQRQAPARWRV